MKTIQNQQIPFPLSAISMGTADFGDPIHERQAFALLDEYITLGGNFIDTAHVYADWIPGTHSSSEKIIGRWLKDRKINGAKRDALFIASKGAHPPLWNMQAHRLSREEIVKDIDEGLLYTGLDYFDLYYLHRDNPAQPVGEMMECLNEQIRLGKIRYIGCSNWTGARIEEANRYCAEKGLAGFVASQILYSLAEPNEAALWDKTMVHMTKGEHSFYAGAGLLLTAFSSQAKGYFTKLDAGAALGEGIVRNYASDKNNRLYEKIRELAQNLHISVSAAALAYTHSQPFDAIPVVGCKTVEQLRDSLAYADFSLPTEAVAELDRIKFTS